MPPLGSGIVQKFSKRKKKGSQIRKVGMSENPKIGRSDPNLFIVGSILAQPSLFVLDFNIK